MKNHVVTGPIRHLSQCHPTITNSYSYIWIRNRVFLETKFTGDFANFQKISRITRRKNNSSRFPEFPGVLLWPHTWNSLSDDTVTPESSSSFCQLIKISFAVTMELSIERRTCDQEVAGSSLGRAHGVKTLGKFLTLTCLCHQAV